MKKSENLWPSDLGNTKITMPKEILMQQANFLSEMTKNLLVAEIKTNKGIVSGSDDPVMVHEFIVKAPAMGNYQFTLLRAMHNFSIYPVGIYNTLTEEKNDAPSEEKFLELLAKIFNMDKTKNAINSMLAQSV